MDNFDQHKAENQKQGHYLDGTPLVGNTDQNWREHMLQALKDGKLTTTITFNETKYLVTLQPIDNSLGTIEGVSLCANCGQIVLKSTAGPKWYHQNPRDGNHAAIPEIVRPRTAAAATPVQTALAGPRCLTCNRPIAYNGANWVHIENTYLDHDAAAPEGIGPRIAVQMPPDPPVGTRATCRMCKKPIVFVSPYWQHEGLLSPRHPAVPIEE